MNKISFFLLACFLIIGFSAKAERPIRGTYEVPVTDELKSFASYPVKFKADTYQENPNQIDFPLPAALVGEETLVKMTRTDSTSDTWSGPNVLGQCQMIERYFTCKVKFNNLQIDTNKVEAVVSAQFPDATQTQGRLAVASLFHGEPIGILRYKLRGRESK